MNKELYESLSTRLNSLEKPSPAEVRNMLTESLKPGLSLSDVTATLAAFYDYTHDKVDFSFLEDFYTKTFSSYYGSQKILNDIEKIAKDKLLVKSIIRICNDEVVRNLRNALNDFNHAQKLNDDYSYQAICDYANRESNIKNWSQTYDVGFTKEQGNNVTLNEPAKDTDGSFQADANYQTQAEAAKAQDIISNQIDDLYNKYNEIENQRQEKVSNMVDKLSGELGVDAERLYSKFENAGVDVYSADDINASKEVVNYFTKVNSLPSSRFESVIRKVQTRIMFKDLELKIAEFDGKRIITLAPGAKMDKFASTSRDVVSDIVKAANQKRSIMGMVNDFGRGLRDGFVEAFNRSKLKGMYDNFKSEKGEPSSPSAYNFSQGNYEDFYTGRDNIPSGMAEKMTSGYAPSGLLPNNQEVLVGGGQPVLEERNVSVSEQKISTPETKTVNRRPDGTEFVITARVRGGNHAGTVPNNEYVKKGRTA